MSDQNSCAKQAAISVLTHIDPRQPYGTELFNAIARVSVSVAVEAVILRRNSVSKVIEVLLVQRDEHDAAYPGQMHCPGTVMRVGESINDMFDRLSRTEFTAEPTKWVFVGFDNNPAEARGHFLHLIYLVQLDHPARGGWYPVDDLPANTIEHHRLTVIPTAVREFDEY